MQRISTIFLQSVIVFAGIGMVAALLIEPHFEGVNANAAFLDVYIDPFLFYVYIGSIPFFIALYQGFLLIGNIRNTTIFSAQSIHALRTIRYCAMALVAFVAGAGAFILIVQRRIEEDIAGGIAMCLFAIAGSVIVAAAAVVAEGVVRRGINVE